jgi:glycosyltransferase involved in cell wall biosynthesis
MKIVHVEDFIHPDAGYQVNLMAPLQVKDGHQVTIVTAELDKVPSYLTQFFGKDNIEERDNRFYRETGVRIIRVPLLSFYSGRAIFYPRIFTIVDELKPDVVFVHGEDTFTGMTFIWRSQDLKYPIVFDCHSLEISSMNRLRHVFRFFYKRLITPKMLKNKIPLIRVVDSDFVQKCLGIPLEYTILLSFGTDTDRFRPKPESRINLLSKYNLREDTILVLYAGKLNAHKGGKFFAEAIFKKLNSRTSREIVFIIIGNTEGDYGKMVEEELSNSKNRIIRLPTQRYFDLAYFYQSADLAVFPKQCSMSFFEVQSCGLPVLFEENEINSQRAQFNNAITFKPGDIDDFRDKLISLIDMPSEQYRLLKENSRKYILENFDFVSIAKRFTEVLHSAVQQRKST